MTKLGSNNVKLNLAGLGIVQEELTEENFENWKNCLKNYFVGNGLWGVVSGKETKPDKKNEQEHEKWKKKNALALHVIQLSCRSTMYSEFKGHISTHDVWTHLTYERGWDNDEESHDKDNGSSENLDYWPLYKAIKEGNWHDTNEFFQQKELPFNARVSAHKETALHIATLSGQTEIVEKLVKSMEPQDLELTNEYGATALSLAAICGAKKLAEKMISKNKKLVTMVTKGHEDGRLPVIVAASYGQEKMVRYLYKVTPKDELSPEKGENGVTLLNRLITAKIYDVASMLLNEYPNLGVTQDHSGNSTLKILAQKPSAFLSGIELTFWERWIYYSLVRKFGWGILQLFVPEINYIYQRKLVHVEVAKFLSVVFEEMPQPSKSQLEKMHIDQIIYDAIQHGILEFIKEMIKWNPEIIRKKDKNGKTIFSHAIALRQEEIYSLIFDLGTKKSIIAKKHDIFKNNFLHLAAKLSPPSQLERVSGEALQMQRELQWFKEVENIVQPKLKEEKNEFNKTPEMVFRDEHKKLAKEAENWMKNTATSSMIVGTLIVAVMFTTAFTVPGGNKNDTGLPTMLETQRTPFLIFMISNALSMFSSSMSLLMFLGILTAHYAEEEFLKSLPFKLIIGLTCLFFSIVTMMASFGSALYLILQEKLSWVTIPIIVLSTIPIVIFSILQFPILIEMTIRTFGAGIFDKPKKKSCFARFRACWQG
ncbi:ankyrin repeat-containing ITN1-like isoform X2 [Olea europaea subsp. europaea]|uniref:Ankyrin repeat-containing ITN1-like isoform X2 n=1 Tax=Olea europaea subsp. europaea TaxID=158383 RepID=A0A8S0RWS9_OLEEU|nr:ankyrin repeat-containing ITN1-like isoform X2 [Olea europaea subsp. europaea]